MGGVKSKWKLVLTFAAVTRYTPLAGHGFLQGPLTTPPTATGQAHVRGKPSELHQRGSARPQLGQAPAPTELAAPKNSPARRGSEHDC